MATWKKLLVSGSNISQLFNDVGYITSAEEANAFSTASFNGTNLLADSSTGTLNFTSGSSGVAGILISASANNDTLDFSLGSGSVPNTALTNPTLTLGDTTLTLGGTTTTVNNLTLTNVIATGSFSGSFVGTTDLPDLTDGDGISDFTYDGSTTATISVQADSTTGGNTVPVSVGSNGVGLEVSTIVGTGVSADGSGNIDVDYGSTAGTSVEGNTNITINGTSNEIEITGTPSQALGGGPSYTVGLPDDVTITQDLTVSRNLTVLGTASFQSTEDLDVADRFIRLASGSNANGDGGIVVQQDGPLNGEAFAFDSITTRWGVTSSFDASQNAYTPDAFMALSLIGSGEDPTSVASRYQAAGNIFIGTDENIWIYS